MFLKSLKASAKESSLIMSSVLSPLSLNVASAFLLLTLIAPLASSQNPSTAVPPASQSAGSKNDPAHPTIARGWVETRLFFGLGPAGAPGVGISEARWHRFLDQEVTSRFPAGLSVINVYGQWQGIADRRPGTPSRLRSKMLLIDYPPTGENIASIEAIRSAWKRLTGDQSVLEVTQPVDVSF